MRESDDERRARTGGVVSHWLRRRGMTRAIFAARMGRSVSWVDKIRTGDRQLDRVSVLRQIATVLDVPLVALLDPDRSATRHTGTDDVVTVNLQTALMGTVLEARDQDASIEQMRQRLAYGWACFHAGNYVEASRTLPALVATLHSTVARQREADGRALLVHAYQLAAELCYKAERCDIGLLAADRSLRLAEESDDPVLVGIASRRVAHALMAMPGTSNHALSILDRAAGPLRPRLARVRPEAVSAYGMLRLKGAVIAARTTQPSLARDLCAEAEKICTLVDDSRRTDWSCFGRANVAVHRVTTLADMHGAGRVLEAAVPVESLAELSRERRASYLIALARGHIQAGQPVQAAEMLVSAERLAAHEVVRRAGTRSLINQVLVSSTPIPAFRALAARAGVVA